MNKEKYINQEVRIRLLEELIKEGKENFKSLESKIVHLDSKMNAQFLMILGIFLTALITKLFV